MPYLTAEESEQYLKHCATDRQALIISRLAEVDTITELSRELGTNDRNMRRVIELIKARAAASGYSPEHDMTKTVPDGFAVKGTSTLYSADGEKKMQWVKTSIDLDRQIEIMREVVESMKEDITPAKPVKASINHRNSEIINQYTITDYHFGMKAWREETGASWDLDIAEKTLVTWFQQAIELSPNAEQCIFAQLGDMLHFDGLLAMTPTSGHILDADTRFQKVVRMVIRTIRQVVSMLLEKYSKVHLLMAEGNHDLASSVWLRELFASLYSEEPRITVEDSPDIYYAFEFGNVALFYHHGHKKKVAQMDSVFVAKFREMYGRTTHHYAHAGHYHFDYVKESNLMRTEQHRTLASPDSHASRGGWISGRDAKVITYHKKYGEVGRVIVNFEAVQDTWI